MSAWTDYVELGFLDFWFRNQAFGKPAGLEVSWHTQSPTDSGSLANEIDLTGGARLAINFPDTVGRSVTNTGTFTIPSSAASGTVTHWALHRTDLAGQMLCYAQLTAPIAPTIGVPITIDPSAMTWTWPDNDVFTDYVVSNWLNHILAVSTATAPTAWRHSLHNGDPAQSGANEFVGGSYGDIAITFNAAAGAAGDFSEVTNAADLNYTGLAASDTPIAWWGVWDQTKTNFLAKSDQADQVVGDGDNATAAAGTLSLQAA